MAMTDIGPARGLFPSASGAGQTGQTIDSTDDWVAWILPWPGGDFTRVSFVVITATGSPVVTAQLFNVDSSDGTTTPVNTGSAIGSAVDSGTLIAGTIETITGIGQSSLTAGNYAIRLIFKSGTSTSIQLVLTGAGIATTGQFPFIVRVLNGGAQTRLTNQTLSIGVGSNSALTPIFGVAPPAIVTAVTFSNATNPDEAGIWFANPLPVSVRICGVCFPNTVSTRPDVTLTYYTGTLGSPSADLIMSLDRDVAANGGSGSTVIQLSTKQTLASGSFAGILFRATSAQNWAFPAVDFLTGNEAFMDGFWGQNATLATRNGGSGALTQTTFRTPTIVPLIDGIDPGSGSSTGVGVLTGGAMAR